MTASELDILAFFHGYDVGPAEMLFFNPGGCRVPPASFEKAMRSLIQKGLVVKERPSRAYSLTKAGYRASCSIGE